jgi:hypothetical protein
MTAMFTGAMHVAILILILERFERNNREMRVYQSTPFLRTFTGKRNWKEELKKMIRAILINTI